VRQALTAAARALFTRRAFNEVGIREIAAAANATPAMIHYYFGDKEGLYVAMLEDVLQRLLAQLHEAATAGTGGDPLVALLRIYITTLARDPWIPRLLVREVLVEGAPFRDRFIKDFASQGAVFVPALLRDAIANGRLRADLDPILATLSLVGMAAFPFIAFPVASRVFQISIDAEFRERFIAHTARLFLRGAAAGDQP
jgi:TetR/AcrR family transcriptional regulator